MLRIAICDDEDHICARLETVILTYMEEENLRFSTDVFGSAEDLLKGIETEGAFDLIFLDIEMDGISGIELGKMIREVHKDEMTRIVYISWMSSYALDLFQVRPLDFLVKPLEAERIIFNIEKCMELLGEQTKYFIYNKDNQAQKYPAEDIRFFESANRMIRMHTTSGVIEFYDKLAEVEKRLDDKYFWRVHKSYLVNYLHVDDFEYTKLLMDDGRTIGISQKHRAKVRELQKNFLGKGD